MIQVTVGIWNPGATQLVCYSDPFCIWIPYVTLVWKSVSTFFSSCASTSLLKDQKSQSSVSTSTEDAASTSIDNVVNVEKTKMSVAAELSQALSTGILSASKLMAASKGPFCCVFWPAFGCCAHSKAGRTTFFQPFSTFFSDFSRGITEKGLKWTKKVKNGWNKAGRNTQHPLFELVERLSQFPLVNS